MMSPRYLRVSADQTIIIDGQNRRCLSVGYTSAMDKLLAAGCLRTKRSWVPEAGIIFWLYDWTTNGEPVI
jgi:hypothetical protein